MIQNPLKPFARRLAKTVAELPITPPLLRLAAKTPPAMKSGLYMRVMASIAARAHLAQRELIETNLGISRDMLVAVPLAKYNEVFGRPQTNPGERATIAIAALIARHANTFIDVGANEGLYTFVMAALWGQSRHRDIHWFEPDVTLFNRLSSNLARNGIKAVPNRLAASAGPGKQTFYRNLDDDFSGSLNDTFTKSHRTEAVEVETIALGAYLVEHDIRNACIKIDVEGAGVAAWRGLRDAAERISSLIMEIIGPEADEGLPAQIVADTGWHAYYIADYSLTYSPRGAPLYTHPFFNWLFTSHAPDAMERLLAGTRVRLHR